MSALPVGLCQGIWLAILAADVGSHSPGLQVSTISIQSHFFSSIIAFILSREAIDRETDLEVLSEMLNGIADSVEVGIGLVDSCELIYGFCRTLERPKQESSLTRTLKSFT